MLSEGLAITYVYYGRHARELGYVSQKSEVMKSLA